MQAFFQSFVARYYQFLLVLLLLIIIGLTFYMGFLEGKRSPSQAVSLSCNQNILSKLSIPLQVLAAGTTPAAATTAQSGNFIGSKNGTKYYPSLTCSAVKRIKPDNYIWFDNAQDAQLQGYTAGKC